MVKRIIIVLNDGRVACAYTLESMIELVEQHKEMLTNTIWISENGYTELKDKKETLRWIREEY